MAKNKIKKCGICSKYTMKEKCCGNDTEIAHPARYSTKDLAAKYRRKSLE